MSNIKVKKIKNCTLKVKSCEQVVPLNLYDGFTKYTIYVSPEVHAHATQDLSFASSLLDQHKTSLTKQASNALSTNIENNSPNVLNFDCLDVDSSDEVDSFIDEENIVNNNSNNLRLNWTSQKTQLLLHLYEKHSTSLDNGEIKNNRLFWKYLQQGMAKEGYKFTVEQLKTKINNLKKMFKDVQDHNAQSGNNRKTCEHYDILYNLFSKKPWIKPLSSAGSDIPMGKELEEELLSSKRKKLSTSDWKSEFVEEYKRDKQLTRKETAEYRKQKLNILREIAEAMKK
ncbi:unnamed protein product [Lasius platythorax]|uniref:Myb/SANT-like DNA-binding domain-containing protein n=1 Tax=Lasius platythorax TaxID=488582 RepID=A0AAV2NLB6_9HYME